MNILIITLKIVTNILQIIIIMETILMLAFKMLIKTVNHILYKMVHNQLILLIIKNIHPKVTQLTVNIIMDIILIMHRLILEQNKHIL